MNRTQASDFGWREGRRDRNRDGILEPEFHGAIDVATNRGDNIHATRFVQQGATVQFAGNGSDVGFGPGQAVIIHNPDGTASVTAHLETTSVVAGQSVASGDIVGAARGGRGAHVHYGEFSSSTTINNTTALNPQR